MAGGGGGRWFPELMDTLIVPALGVGTITVVVREAMRVGQGV